MFTRFTQEFEANVVTPAFSGAQLVLGDTALVETRIGWRAPSLLKPGMEVATLDGGFTPVRNVTRERQNIGAYFVPEGALNNCSALCLPEGARIGIEAPIGYDGATSDTLSLPISALEGISGIRQVTSDAGQMYCLSFADEEMVWTNTGALLHAKTREDGFFHELSFGEARAFLHLKAVGHFDQDHATHTNSARNTTSELVTRCA